MPRFITIIILLFLLIPNYSSFADSAIWDEDWSYSQLIKIPFDTSLEIAKFQPIDTTFEFDNPCWAKDENQHSIRVICQKSGEFFELESQIYNLNYSDGKNINSCNLVFLIPELADGSEEYFVYYDDSEKPATNYIDHVEIEESYYYYEPITGYSLESDYYKIIDDDYLSYGVSYGGQIMGYNTCQHIMRMKEGATEALPKYIELFAAFDFKYTYEKSLFGYSSTSQKFLSKEVLVDGNLMLELRIVSTSKYNDLKTTATYKYYHYPSSNARIHAHVKHESLEEITVCSIPPATNTDGVFASLQTGGINSRSIQDLNIGRILPFVHFYNEFGTISEYDVDIDPEYIPDDPDIRIISYLDNVDLGKNAWVSFDEGETGFAHSVIFHSKDVLVSGNNEKEGLQINAFEVDYPHLPGLENNAATIQIGRNSFETGGSHDLVIPSDFIAEFDAEFFSSENDGYSIIDKEAEIFQELVKIKPQSDREIDEDSEEVIKHDLSVVVYNAHSIPFGSSLSVALGLNLSYINVELYKDNEFIYSKNAVRLPLNPIEELEDPSFIEKIISSLKIFDFRNFSIFKKAVFLDINQGRYVIKIYRENQFLTEEKQFIGYAIVDLQEDEKVRVYCRSEASIDVTILDQNNEKVKNAVVTLKKDDAIIAKCLSDEKGQAKIKAPTNTEPYDLIIYYNGLEVYQESVKLGIIQKIIQQEKTVNIQRYTLNLKVLDTWRQAPEIQLNPKIISISDSESYKISAEKIEHGKFVFPNLPPSTYQLSLTFKSFTLNQKVEISDNKKIDLEFPAEYDVNLKIYNSRGIPYENSKIIVTRNGDKLEIQAKDSSTIVTIPPGEYKVEVYNDDELIGARNIGIYGTQNFDIITTEHPSYLIIIMIFCALIIIIFLIFFSYKKQYNYLFITLGIILILLSLFLPWWGINGSTNPLETSTNLYLIPNNMITITTSENTIAGEPSYLPPEFLDTITVLISIAIIACILIPINIYFNKKGKKALEKILKIFSILSLVGPIFIFIIAMNELSKISIGSIIGSGYLDIGVPGESQIHSVLSSWGPAIGFYLYLLSVIVLFSVFFYNYKQKIKEQPKDKKGFDFQHPLFGISFMNWFYLLQKNGGVDNKYILRGLFIGFFSIFFMPIRILFKLKFEEKINNSEITNPPVFIIGHWRSGTTYIHELLCEDPQFCYVTLWQTLLPDSYPLLEPMKKFMAKFLPSERPMDNIKVEIDGPYEEEAGIAVLSPWSFFHGLHFPKNAEEQYVNSIHYTGLSKEEKDQWDKSYYQFMKTVSYTNNGKRLLLKDPANTARIPTLLKLFPDAKFIHIRRNPYKVYLSTVKMRNNVLEKLALQDGNKLVLEKQTIDNYKRLMNAYFEQKKLIPSKNFVEISYEDLVKDPIKQVRKIYSKLKLPGLKNGLPGMRRYLESKKDYKVNVYKIDKKIIQHVKDNWSFTIDKWGYNPP